jgi:hypothetical protein
MAALIIFLSPVVDEMNHMNNLMAISGGDVSQNRLDTMLILSGAFSIMGFVFIIAGGLNYWIISIRSQNQDV